MTRLVFTGGFLGAGKTTLVMKVANILKEQGKKVGLITNDQASDLVDTRLLDDGSVNVAEVTGSCFCCDFKALRRAMDKAGQNMKADILIAEPVGSCTDLSATLINPIKDMMKTEVLVSPLTVLADPARLKAILTENPGLHPSAAYIIKKQLEESDIIAITKTDLYSREEISWIFDKLKTSFPECEVMTLSSRTGEGVSEWLGKVLTSSDAGKHIIDLDYNKYAEGEAILGWLNCSASLAGQGVNWDSFTRDFMSELASKFDKNNRPVGHVKAIVENGDQYIAANQTGGSDTLSFRWSAGISDSAEMIVNARVEMSPGELEETFLDALRKTTNGKITAVIKRLKCISPGYPNPSYRYKIKI